MSNAIALSLALPTQDLGAYKRAVHQFPLLEEAEERQLAERLRDQNDLDAAWQLVASHLRFVVKVARGYAGYGLQEADLIQEGNVGLMKAVKRFDPEVGVRLVSFAVHWIRAEIHEFVLRNWRIVKVATTKAQRKLFFNLRKSKTRLAWLDRTEADSIAADLGVSTDEVFEMERRLAARDEGLDLPGDEDAYTPANYLHNEADDPALTVESAEWEEDSNGRIAIALEGLDERSRDIIERRWLAEEKPTLHELAAEYGVSAERIRQIEAAALKKLRRSFD